MCVVPVFGLGRASCVVLSPLVLSSPPPLLCSLSQRCWFSVCLCDRVVSLWNSGDGCAGRKSVWGLLSTVNSLCVVGCVSVWCVLCCCAVLWNGGVWWSRRLSSSSSSSFLLLVFGVVRAQLCEHACYPRTPLRLSCCLLCLFFSFHPAPRLSSLPAFPVIVEWRWGFTMCRCA